MATIVAPPLTIEEFSSLPSDGERHEMSEGTLLTMPPPKSLHTRVAVSILRKLESHLEQRGGAEALPEAGYVLFQSPLTIRQPDVSVLSETRLRATAPDDYFEGSPQLAVEVISPSDTAEDIELKVEQYLKAGAEEVWVVYPKTKSVHLHRSGGEARILSVSDTLASRSLPEFSVKVSELFPQ